MNVALLKATFKAFGDDKAQRLAAAIAYSTIFSIAPLFIVVIAIVGGILDIRNGHGGHTATLNALVDSIRRSAGPGTADTVRSLIVASFNKPKQGLIAQILGWIFFIIGASGLFAALQDALNAIWHVEGTKGGFKTMLRDRLASFAMILVVGLLLLVTFLANASLSFVSAHFANLIPFAANPTVLTIVDQILNIAIVTVIFALLYKVLPDVKIAWNDVWVGAAATSVLFTVGELLIGLYIAHGGVASAYGAAGSLLVALIWIYYSALILLLGAEFTKVRASHATLTVAATVRHTTEQPAGVDPREAAAVANPKSDAGEAKRTSDVTPTAHDLRRPTNEGAMTARAPDARAIRLEIDATRDRLAATAEALAHRVDVPARVRADVGGRIEAVRNAFGAAASNGVRPHTGDE